MSFSYRKLLPGLIFTCTALFLLVSCSQQKNNTTLDLSGKWAFKMDSSDVGVEQKWFSRQLEEFVNLPGSMLTSGKGNEVKADSNWTGGIWNDDWFKKPEYAKYRQPGNVKVSFWLQPLKRYAGVAWYQKEFNIPEEWQNRFVELFLERCHWETTVWVDQQKIGMQNALGTPHVFSVGKNIQPGKHVLTIRVDNRVKDIDPGADAHSISDNTQTNWNGIIGDMKLISLPMVHLGEIQLYPDIHKKIVTVNITINNNSGKATEPTIELTAVSKNATSIITLPSVVKKVQAQNDKTVVTVEYPMGDKPLLWDEFHPNLYTLRVNLSGAETTDQRSIDFGMRKIGIKGTQMTINDHPIFLRGTLECAIFPKTGFPPTTSKEWEHIFRICKSFGLNHIRFHSWCPPLAAFEVADKEGFYLSVESSAWASLGDGKPIDQFIYDESNRIVSTFGNHPSFCLMPYGNEASGNNAEKFLTGFVQYWQKKDQRRLYTSASGFPTSKASDYHSTGNPRIQWWLAGLTSPINAKPPTTDFDWTTLIEKDKPTVSHEIGQWCVYPDFREMKKYDGVLKPKNFEIFLDRLKENGMESLADSFLLASGKLQVLCYKADIEAALRTPSFAGFQLLDLHDFPGQGTALVGVLNAFWEEKGYVTASEYRRFCNQTVPLARLPKMIYNNNEELAAKFCIAHYGESQLKKISPQWKLTDANGKIIQHATLKPVDLQPGNVYTIDSIRLPLNMISQASQLKLTFTVDTLENSWDLWVYPAQLPAIPNEQQVKVVRELDQSAENYLNNGGTVLLTMKKGALKADKGGDIAIGFSSIFWNTSWTKGQAPHTLGIVCNPLHPALSGFPTEYHSNYQWWDAMSHSNAIRLDAVSPDLKPIVRVIDDWFTARPLGLIFECRIGKGRLLVSGIDLLTDINKRPEAKQLLYSLKSYMTGNSFNPVPEADINKIRALMSR